jgi:ABC-type lipoprotein release transport system permease subunit
VIEGRFTDPSAPSEFTVSRLAAADMDAEVGRTYDFVSLDQDQIESNELFDDPRGPSFEATLVGIVGSISDFDEPASAITFSERFIPAHPDVGVVASILAMYVDDSTSRAAVLDEIRALPFGADVFQMPNQMVTRGARDAVELQANALWIISLISIGAATLVTGQLAARHVRSTVGNRAPLQALGFSRRQVAAEAAMEGLIVGTAAAAVAVVAATVVSGLFPFGVLRVFEPDPGPRADLAVLGVGSLLLIALVAVSAAFTAGRTVASPRQRSRRVAVADQVATLGAPVSMVHGVRFAVSRQVRRGAPPLALMGGVAASVTILTGALVVGVSMGRIVDEPFRYGVNFDELLGNQYQEATADIVTPLAADPDVVDLAAVTVGTVTVADGTDIPIWAFESVKGDLAPVITAGRAPAGDDEVAVGRKLARLLGAGIGDVVTATGVGGGAAELTVVGFAVTADEAGEGATMTFSGYEALAPNATRRLAVVRLREGAPEDTPQRLGEIVATPPTSLTLPNSARALDRVTPTPFLLAVVVTLLLVALFAVNLLASTRERTPDLAVMRALGGDRPQLGGMVHWQSLTVGAVGLAVGLPLGIVIGRRVFTLVANNVGVVPAPYVPLFVPLGVLAGVLVIALTTAAWPAVRAARIDASTALRRS